MSAINKMEVKNEDFLITTESGIQYTACRLLGSTSYEIYTVNTKERLGTFRKLSDVVDAIDTFEKVIRDYNVYCDTNPKEVK